MIPIKVASVQAASVAYNLHASVAKLLPLVQEAATAGARLAVFPEGEWDQCSLTVPIALLSAVH